MDRSIVIPILLMIVIAGVTGFLCLKILFLLVKEEKKSLN